MLKSDNFQFNYKIAINCDEILENLKSIKQDYAIYKKDIEFYKYFCKKNVVYLEVFIDKNGNISLEDDSTSIKLIEIKYELYKNNIFYKFLEDEITEKQFIDRCKNQLSRRITNKIQELKVDLLAFDDLFLSIVQNKTLIYLLDSISLVKIINNSYEINIYNEIFNSDIYEPLKIILPKLGLDKSLLFYNKYIKNIQTKDLFVEDFKIESLEKYKLTSYKKELFNKLKQKYFIDMKSFRTKECIFFEYFITYGLHFKLFTKEELKLILNNEDELDNLISKLTKYMSLEKLNNLFAINISNFTPLRKYNEIIKIYDVQIENNLTGLMIDIAKNFKNYENVSVRFIIQNNEICHITSEIKEQKKTEWVYFKHLKENLLNNVQILSEIAKIDPEVLKENIDKNFLLDLNGLRFFN